MKTGSTQYAGQDTAELQRNKGIAKKRPRAYTCIVQLVTALPWLRQASGFLSAFLHVMKAALGFLQRTAMCFEMDISTADVGGGASSV